MMKKTLVKPVTNTDNKNVVLYESGSWFFCGPYFPGESCNPGPYPWPAC